MLAAAVVPGAELKGFGGAVAVAAIVGVLNAVLPPLIAALRLPFTVAIGFLAVLALDAVILRLAADITPHLLRIDDFGAALAMSLVATAISTPIAVVVGIDDDNAFALQVARRVARRAGRPEVTDTPGFLFLEIDGLALPVLRRAIRDGNTPNMARWLAGRRLQADRMGDGSVVADGGEPGGDPARVTTRHPGVPMGRQGVGADRELLEPRRLRRDRAGSLERRRPARRRWDQPREPALRARRSPSILTASRVADEKKANPGYRAFLANGSNVTRTLVLFFWEVILELVAAARQRRRDVRPRGHRGGSYPLLRAGMCVFVRDLVVFSVLQDMFRGVPAVYATFASYDEVAHHSGLERPDTLEALRKLDQRFGLIERARRYAPRPVRDRRAVRPRADPGRHVPAAQRLRPRRTGASARCRGRGVRRARRRATRTRPASGAPSTRRPAAATSRASVERRRGAGAARRSCSARATSGSIYLMERPHRLDARGDPTSSTPS